MNETTLNTSQIRKRNGAIVFNALVSLGEPVPAKQISHHIAEEQGLSENEIKDTVQNTLRNGVRNGFIRKLGQKYTFLPMNKIRKTIKTSKPALSKNRIRPSRSIRSSNNSRKKSTKTSKRKRLRNSSKTKSTKRSKSAQSSSNRQ